MVDVKSKRCLTPLCDTIPSNKQYRGYCLVCFINTFPDEPVTRNYKTKERTVVDHVLSEIPDVTWVADKRIQDGCSSRRPDLLLDLGSHVLMIEIDEHAHKTYDCSCENKRIMQLSQDIGHRSIVLLRFNPDVYTKEDGEVVKSPWITNGNGIIVVCKKRQPDWKHRLDVLISNIQYWKEHATDKILEVIELFY